MTRGTILSWRVSNLNGRGMFLGQPSRVDLLRALVYYERVHVPMPAINAVTQPFREHFPEREVLRSEGVYEEDFCDFVFSDEPDFYINKYDFGDNYNRLGDYRMCHVATLMADLPFKALRKRSERDEGEVLWSVSQSNMKDIGYPQVRSDLAPDNPYTLRMTLDAALPVPDEATPVEKILDFRQQRDSELLQFRFHMDKITSSVLNGDDVVKAKEQLELSLVDLRRSMDRPKIKAAMSTLSTYLNLGPPAVAGLVALPLVDDPGIVTGVTLSGLAANAALTFGLRRGQEKEVPESMKEVAYLYHVDQLTDT